MTDLGGIAVGIPAHNEADRIDRALTSVVVAAASASLPVTVVVAADASNDGTAARARRRLRRLPANVRAEVIEVHARRAGVAREAACHAADAWLRAWVGHGPRRWIATTDADTEVPGNWLDVHRRWARRGADAITGLVRVHPDDDLAPEVRRHLDRELARAGMGHGHIFGANLGVDAGWWQRVGGFPPVAVGEDTLLVDRLRGAGARVIGVTDGMVITSGRLVPRAPRGFGAKLATLTLESGIPSGAPGCLIASTGRPCE